MSRRKSALAIILAIAMCFTMMPTMAFAVESEKTNIVVFGDSTSSGFGLDDFVDNNGGYDKNNSDLENYAVDTAYNQGRGRISNNSLAWRLKKHIPNSKLTSYCVNGMRTDEVRAMLDKDFFERQNKKEREATKYIDKNGKEVDSDGFFTDHMTSFFNFVGTGINGYEGVSEFQYSDTAANEVKKNIEEADVIVVDNCMNNFGTYLSCRLCGYLNIPEFEWAAGLQNQTIDQIDGISQKTVSQVKVLSKELTKYIDVDESNQELVKYAKFFVDSFAYCYADCLTNLDESIKLIDEINPNAKIIVVGCYNGMKGIELDFGGGTVFDAGDIMNKYFGAVNTYIKGISDQSTRYYYADYSKAAQDVAASLEKDEDGNVDITEFDEAYSVDIINRYSDLTGDIEVLIETIQKASIDPEDENYYANAEMGLYTPYSADYQPATQDELNGKDVIMRERKAATKLLDKYFFSLLDSYFGGAATKLQLESLYSGYEVADLLNDIDKETGLGFGLEEPTAEDISSKVPAITETNLEKITDESLIYKVAEKAFVAYYLESINPQGEEKDAKAYFQTNILTDGTQMNNFVGMGFATIIYPALVKLELCDPIALNPDDQGYIQAAAQAAQNAFMIAAGTAQAKGPEVFKKKICDMIVYSAQNNTIKLSVVPELQNTANVIAELTGYVTDRNSKPSELSEAAIQLLTIMDKFLLGNGLGLHPSKSGCIIKGDAVIRAYDRAMADGYTSYEEVFRDELYLVVGIYEMLKEMPDSEEVQALIKQAEEAQQMLEEYKAKAEQLATITAMEIEYLDTTIKTLQQEVKILKDENEATKAELKVLKKRIAALELGQLQLVVTKKNVLTADEATTVISWNAEDWNLENVEEDTGFLVSKNGGEAEDVGFESSYEDTEAVVGTKATYTVTPYVIVGDEVVKGKGVSVETTPTAKIGAVKSFKVAGTTKGVKATWKKASKATGYVVYYGTSKKSLNKVTVTKTAKTIKGLTAGKSYVVKVKPYRTVAGKNYYGKATAYKTATAK